MSNSRELGIWAFFLLGSCARAEQNQLTITEVNRAETPHRAGQKFRDVSVRVVDEKERPVPNATVVFTVGRGPGGASAYFEGNRDKYLTTTGPDGSAQATALHANGTAGKFEIHVHAAFGGKVGDREISELNEPLPLVTKKRTWIAGVAAAAVLIPLLALRSTPPPKATISIVTPTGPVTHP